VGNIEGTLRFGAKDRQLLLATQTPLKVEFADNTPFTEWPNVEGLHGHHEGNYVAILLLP
jgi:hypothetical protein